VEKSFVSIELLNVEDRAVVGVRAVRGVGVEIDRHGTRPRGTRCLSVEQNLGPPRIRIANEILAREFLLEVTVDLVAEARGRARTAARETPDLVLFEARIRTRDDGYAGVLDDAEGQNDLRRFPPLQQSLRVGT
jgi:hypothetical protein